MPETRVTNIEIKMKLNGTHPKDVIVPATRLQALDGVLHRHRESEGQPGIGVVCFAVLHQDGHDTQLSALLDHFVLPADVRRELGPLQHIHRVEEHLLREHLALDEAVLIDGRLGFMVVLQSEFQDEDFAVDIFGVGRCF